MAVFKKENMVNVPLAMPTNPPAGQYPSSGYSNSPTHSGVHYSPTPVLGSKLWLTHTPYIGYNDDYENPMVYRSDDSVSENFKKTFIPYSENPLVGKYGEPEDLSFNADVDVLLHNEKVHVIHRPVLNKNTTTQEYDWWVEYFQSTDDGNGNLTGFTPPIRLYGGLNNGINTLAAASPALVYWNGNYRIYDLVTTAWNSVGGYCLGLRIMDSPNFGVGSHSAFNFGRIYGYKIEAWHLSVFEHDGKLYSIVCAKTQGYNGNDSGGIYLGQFDSTGTNLYIFRKKLTDFRTYRSDAYIDENGDFHLYAAMFNEPYDAYVSAKLILGAKMKFSSLLKIVKG